MDYKAKGRALWWTYGEREFYSRGKMITLEAYGNINYGYVGKALGIPDVILYAGGGFAAVTHKGADKSWRPDYFFDSEEDHENISWGIQIYNEDMEGMSMVVRVFKYIIKAIIISIILLISAILTVRVVNTFKLNRVQKLLSDLYYEDRLYFEGSIDEKSIGDLEIKQSSFNRIKESLLTLKSIDKDNGNTYFIFDDNGKTWCGIVYASNISQIPRWIHIKPIEEMWYVYWTE